MVNTLDHFGYCAYHIKHNNYIVIKQQLYCEFGFYYKKTHKQSPKAKTICNITKFACFEKTLYYKNN